MKNLTKKIETKEVKETVNSDLLKKMIAIGITEKVKNSTAKGGIFKKEYSNKKSRDKSRTILNIALSNFLVHLAHNKKDLALIEFNIIKENCIKYYIAEDKFLNANDYATNQNKFKETFVLFLENAKEFINKK